MSLFVPDEELSPLVSKLGGVPYLPISSDIPLDSEGNPMVFLGQLNFGGIEGSGLDIPSKGLLQFWVSASVGYFGMCFEKGEDGFAAVFHPAPDISLQRRDAASVIVDGTPDALPFEGEIGCSFAPSTCTWNGVDDGVTEPDGFPEDAVFDFIEDKGGEWENPPFHRVGGYAYFTQSDPRGGLEDKDEWVLLWQVDTDDDVNLMWGDCGVANAFIKKSDLAECRFDRLLWNWDCC